MPTSSPQRRTFVAVFILVAAVIAASLAWVVASPVGSSPDEDFHVGSMWCPPPVDETGCQISTKDGEKAVMVPQSLAKEHVTCYAFDHNNSALCALNASDDKLAPTLRWDDGNYPWGYYQFAHLFVQRSTSHAVLALRTVNTLLAIGLIGAIIALADSGLKRAISVAVTVAWLPMGFYFVAGMNPSSWAMTGTFAFGAALLAATRSVGPRRAGLIACALAGAVLACTSRGDSAFYLFVVTVALAFAVPLSRRIIPEAALACVASVVGIWVMTRTNVAASHLGSRNELAQYSLKHIAWLNVSSLPHYLSGFVDWPARTLQQRPHLPAALHASALRGLRAHAPGPLPRPRGQRGAAFGQRGVPPSHQHRRSRGNGPRGRAVGAHQRPRPLPRHRALRIRTYAARLPHRPGDTEPERGQRVVVANRSDRPDGRVDPWCSHWSDCDRPGRFPVATLLRKGARASSIAHHTQVVHKFT